MYFPNFSSYLSTGKVSSSEILIIIIKYWYRLNHMLLWCLIVQMNLWKCLPSVMLVNLIKFSRFHLIMIPIFYEIELPSECKFVIQSSLVSQNKSPSNLDVLFKDQDSSYCLKSRITINSFSYPIENVKKYNKGIFYLFFKI